MDDIFLPKCKCGNTEPVKRPSKLSEDGKGILHHEPSVIATPIADGLTAYNCSHCGRNWTDDVRKKTKKKKKVSLAPAKE